MAEGLLYPTPHEKAAALLHSVARCRALIDGNERTAWLATEPRLTRADLRLSTGASWDLFPMTHHVECVAMAIL